MSQIRTRNDRKKKFLKEYRAAVVYQNLLQDEIDQLRSSKIMPSVTMDGMPRGNGSGADLSVYAAQIDRLIRKMEKALKEKLAKRDRVIHAIEQLEDEKERVVLRYRYIHLQQTDLEKMQSKEGTRMMTWAEIAAAANYSESRTIHIHGTALTHLKIERGQRK